MTISITVVGETIAEIYQKLGAKAAGFASDKDLIEELRSRMRPQGLVVNIDPAPEPAPDDGSEADDFEAADEAAPSPAPLADKPRRGRPRKDAAAPAPENGKAAARETAAPATTAATVTRDDVIAALNAFSTARGGQVAGRQIMQDVCGATKLIEVKPEDYAKLVAALKV